ncbi:MAG: hypothetical protein M1459_00570, partial [Patescibacteria group bacterium]|nr:hypothetical protein [Patescibacteria group bacterium]
MNKEDNTNRGHRSPQHARSSQNYNRPFASRGMPRRRPEIRTLQGDNAGNSVDRKLDAIVAASTTGTNATPHHRIVLGKGARKIMGRNQPHNISPHARTASRHVAGARMSIVRKAMRPNRPSGNRRTASRELY